MLTSAVAAVVFGYNKRVRLFIGLEYWITRFYASAPEYITQCRRQTAEKTNKIHSLLFYCYCDTLSGFDIQQTVATLFPQMCV